MKRLSKLLYLFLILPLSLAHAETESFGDNYKKAENLLIEKNYGEFGDLIAALIKGREDEGYLNLVPLSERLIESGRSICAMKEANCSFFIRTAVLLSPTDPWTYFSASTLSPGIKDSAALFFSALKFARNSPTFFFKSGIVFGVCILALFSLYITLKLLFGVVRFELKKLSPAGIGIFAVLSLIGLPFGLISTAACWSGLIFLFVGRKREIFQLLVITLLWIAFLPTAENMLKFVSRPEEREMELLLSNIASPSSQVSSPQYLNEPLYLGSKFYREGKFESAKEQFLLAKGLSRESSMVALSRLSAAQLGLKQYADAKTTFANIRSQGLNSYESVHNEAILAASSVNLNESRELLDKLRGIDKNRLAKASLSTGILLDPLPLSEFAARYSEPIEKHLHSAPAAVQWISSEKVLSPLCSLGLVGLLILSSIMAGMLIVPASKIRRFV